MPPDIQYMLGQMNTKLDTLIQRTSEDRENHTKLETRVSKLEQYRWHTMGAASAIGAVAGFLATLLGR